MWKYFSNQLLVGITLKVFEYYSILDYLVVVYIRIVFEVYLRKLFKVNITFQN